MEFTLPVNEDILNSSQLRDGARRRENIKINVESFAGARILERGGGAPRRQIAKVDGDGRSMLNRKQGLLGEVWRAGERGSSQRMAASASVNASWRLEPGGTSTIYSLGEERT